MFDAQLPMYATETRFYCEVLAISFEFGSHLRKFGLLTPDAVLDTGGVLYLLTSEKVREAGAQVSVAKTHKDQAAETVST